MFRGELVRFDQVKDIKWRARHEHSDCILMKQVRHKIKGLTLYYSCRLNWGRIIIL